MLEMNTKNNTGGRRSSSSKPKSTSGSKPKAKANPFAKKTFKDSTSKEVKDKNKQRFIDYKDRTKKGDPMPKFNDDAVRLNKFLSNAGVASRRDADVLIQSGVIAVNDVIVTEMGYKIKPGDSVKYDGETINAEKKRYVLLNKPKGFITTTDDPMGRKTVMSLVQKACKEIVYPIGKLEREATGLLLFTNDGDLFKKLTHPQYKNTKIYHVEADKNVSKEDVNRLMEGVYLDDGKVICDNAEFVTAGTGREIGIELSSGKNKVVRRLMEAMGYEVVKLDRVKYAGLTKKDLPRGFFRHLTEKEVAFLKMS